MRHQYGFDGTFAVDTSGDCVCGPTLTQSNGENVEDEIGWETFDRPPPGCRVEGLDVNWECCQEVLHDLRAVPEDQYRTVMHVDPESSCVSCCYEED